MANLPKRPEYTFIEITTKSGEGAFMQKTPGVTVFKPLALTWPKKFYVPKYTAKDSKEPQPPRPTLFWESDIITDKNGNARVSFARPATAKNYSVILEGCDMDGNIGAVQETITIKEPAR